jgi:hypothetical protein
MRTLETPVARPSDGRRVNARALRSNAVLIFPIVDPFTDVVAECRVDPMSLTIFLPRNTISVLDIPR